jgi:DNA processing protein
VVSEFPLDAEPLPERFPRRNRLISGLAAAVVVVEAARRSGSLSTASHALDQGREVMAVPGPVSSDQSAGCHGLIQQGAKLIHEVEDILVELSPMYAAAIQSAPADAMKEEVPNLDGLQPDEAAVLALLDDPEPVQLDVLADHAPFGVARLQAALFGLEARGAVELLPGGHYLARRAHRGPG